VLAGIVPFRVPPKIPVPVNRLRLIEVTLNTLAGVPLASWAWTVTENAVPAIGFAPPFTEVIVSFVGRIRALYVAIAAAHRRLELNVPVAAYVPVALTIRYSGLMVMLFAALPPLVPARLLAGAV